MGFQLHPLSTSPQMKKDVNAPMQGILIALAEDDSDDIQLFQDALTSCPLTCRLNVYKNGQDLLNDITDSSFEVPQMIFLDINMPIKSGMEALFEIRDKISPRLPVFLLSTANDRLTVEQARKAHATGYLAKPSDAGGLSSILTNILSINWLQRSADDFYVHL